MNAFNFAVENPHTVDCWARNDFQIPIAPPSIDLEGNLSGTASTWDAGLAVNTTVNYQSYFMMMFIFSLLLLVSTMMVQCLKNSCKGTTTFYFIQFIAFCAFELMWIYAITGVKFRTSREGAVCAGDYIDAFPQAATNYPDMEFRYYKRSGTLIHVSAVILTTVGSIANFMGLYGSFYFYNRDEE